MARKSESAAKAPAGLALVADFVNTLEPDGGADALDTPAALARWLRTHELEPGAEIGATDLEQTHRLREALRALLLANNGEPIEPVVLRAVRDISRQVLLRVEIGAGGAASVAPAGGGVAALFARLLMAVAAAQVEGTWERIKACRGCGRAFYDRSRNRSRTWCSMSACGNRAKIRAYRLRRAAARVPAGRRARV